MTRAKKLKRTVRARAQKTGESYTAARRQVLTARRSPAAKASDTSPARAPERPSVRRRGGPSEASILARTGFGYDHWFAILDAFGTGIKGHAAAARHLHEQHAVPGWHAQGITVAYERARGLRAVNQASTGFQVSVSRVVAASVTQVARAFDDPRGRAAWLDGVAPELRRTLEDAFASAKQKQISVREKGDTRFRYKWGRSAVELALTPKGENRSSITAATTKLADAREVELRRAQWTVALEGLKAYLARST